VSKEGTDKKSASKGESRREHGGKCRCEQMCMKSEVKIEVRAEVTADMKVEE
jgi:hypothetical protein